MIAEATGFLFSTAYISALGLTRSHIECVPGVNLPRGTITGALELTTQLHLYCHSTPQYALMEW
jgi:hypothetical protein